MIYSKGFRQFQSVADAALGDPAVANPWLNFFPFFLSENFRKMEIRYPE
jgi:hypothetical protein